MDCGLPGSSVHGIFQARILEWVAISFSRRSSLPRDWIWVSCIVGRRFTIWATREVQSVKSKYWKDRHYSHMPTTDKVEHAVKKKCHMKWPKTCGALEYIQQKMLKIFMEKIIKMYVIQRCNMLMSGKTQLCNDVMSYSVSSWIQCICIINPKSCICACVCLIW